jgi:hypothetical protein
MARATLKLVEKTEKNSNSNSKPKRAATTLGWWEVVIEPSHRDPFYLETLRKYGRRPNYYSVMVEARSERTARLLAKGYEHSAIVSATRIDFVEVL